MSKEQINELTPEQEAKIPEYKERFLKIGTCTRPTDRAKAEDAVARSYAYLNKKDPNQCVANPTFFWAESPVAGAKLAAQKAKGDDNVTTDEIRAQAEMASFGSFEAYWVSTYSFIANELPVEKDELPGIVEDIVKECGVFWTFHDIVVMTPKPSLISIEDEKLSSLTGKAIEYPNGDGFHAFKGEYKGSLMEVMMASRNEGNPDSEEQED